MGIFNLKKMDIQPQKEIARDFLISVATFSQESEKHSCRFLGK
jgi:hypothetical protein